MKKTAFVIFILFLLPAFEVFSQETGWEIEMGVSAPLSDRYPSMILGGRTSEIMVGRSEVTPLILPTFSVSAGCHLKNLPLSIHTGLYVNYASQTLSKGPGPLTEKETIFHLIPEIRYYYLERNDVKLYCSLGIGARVNVFSETLNGDTVTGPSLFLAWQLVPFTVSYGKRFNFSLGIGLGSAWCPACFSVGYRFGR